ncbi:Hemolysin secretion protein D, chromosomal [Paraburkholderia solisilvae]|uniref:Membrane fusion protein (MFP) family protein n=2 Tax=Paraburkholderia solisilvae TaxID=624376 RepID=A0A6J5DEP2_9BURK|nr:Hemolysin secretion protein D, chromosomal [Paraburkholderia solisilvae]
MRCLLQTARTRSFIGFRPGTEMRVSLWLAAAGEFGRRYLAVLRTAWHERDNRATRWSREESEFLPAALALQRMPVSPLPRVTAAALLALLSVALLWAVLGKIDIVATAHGKVIPDGRTKLVQPLETARVAAIRVADGSFVKSGDTLLELDSAMSAADRARLRDDCVDSTLSAARARAFLAILDTGRPQPLEAPDDADPPTDDLRPAASRIAREQTFLDGEIAEYRAKLARLDADIARNAAELDTAGAVIRRLQATLEIARARESDLRELAAKQYVSRHEFLDKQQSRIEMEGELAAHRSRVAEIRASIVSVRRQREEFVMSTRRETLDRLSNATQKAAEWRQEFVKADVHHRTMTLQAPVDGVVQQLAVHTIGGVVTAAQPLMVIVPADHPLEIEAFIENKDVGFVNTGQSAAVKIEAFPYTRYGTLAADVVNVSHDAIEDEKRGLIYAVRLKLRRPTITVEGGQMALSPGMAASVEIATGRRRVIEYFLDPLLTHVRESLVER